MSEHLLHWAQKYHYPHFVGASFVILTGRDNWFDWLSLASHEQVDEAWGRAQVWEEKYGMKEEVTS